VVVESVLKNLHAERAGIRRGDIIVSVKGKKITTRKEFISLIENKQLDDHELSVINRNGQLINFDVEPRMVKVHDFQQYHETVPMPFQM
jgi:S1-C subfamily serine protease